MEEGRLHSTFAILAKYFHCQHSFPHKQLKPGFGDEPGLRLAIAPAMKAQQRTENAGVHQLSQLHWNQGKRKLNLDKDPVLLWF